MTVAVVVFLSSVVFIFDRNGAKMLANSLHTVAKAQQSKMRADRIEIRVQAQTFSVRTLH